MYRFDALRASNGLFEWGAAVLVDENGRRPFAGVPAITPTHEGDKGGGEVGPLGRQPVLVAHRSGLVGDFFDDSVVDQLGQPIG